mmetsp:Transcript_17443/g.32129  ORF Transcript_17443/g.32129 Transcript_17443/m.32129 type:complete len:101 (-) Transcript_17443:3-305(-)
MNELGCVSLDALTSGGTKDLEDIGAAGVPGVASPDKVAGEITDTAGPVMGLVGVAIPEGAPCRHSSASRATLLSKSFGLGSGMPSAELTDIVGAVAVATA